MQSKKPQPDSIKQQDTTTHSTSSQQSEPKLLSQTAQTIKQYQEALSHLPDTRTERIIKIQQALKEGTYSVSSQVLADKLIQELSNTPPEPSTS